MHIRSLLPFALLLGAAAANANLLANGSFEDVSLPGQEWEQFSSVSGWTADLGKIEIGKANVYGVAGQTGTNVLELDSTQNSIVTQTLNLGAGSYSLSFDYARRANTSDVTNQFDVLWNGQVVADLTPSLTSFASATYTVNGVAGTNTLSFRAKGDSDSLGGMIDNVSVQAVPEPATMATLAVGGLGLLKRRNLSKRK